jgi:hypothetical protein
MEAISEKDLAMVWRQAVYIDGIKKGLDREGKVILTAKHRNRINMIAQTLYGFRLYLMAQKSNP